MRKSFVGWDSETWPILPQRDYFDFCRHMWTRTALRTTR